MPTCDTKELAEALGVTTGRISQLKTQGRFDGCFTVVRHKIEWDKEAAIKAFAEGNPLVSVSPTRKTSAELEIPTFNESRAKSEHFRAELARLDLEVKEDQLVEVARVQREAFTAARAVRDALGNIPDRVSNQLAAESDPVVIHQTLTEEIRKALETLTNELSINR
jgi:phage terminase Nu1 subunit (DNA packaging protein)